MEQQAKERLTGAGILVVVLVLLVPEFLTGPRRVLPALPAQPDQAPMRSYTLELGESRHANSAPVAASTATPSVSESPAASSALVAISQTAPRSAATLDVPPPSPSPASDAATSVAAPPHAVAHSGTEHSSNEHSTGSWTVQLGTFSNRDNAARLVTTLKSHGFSASLSEVTKSGHKLFRVRVGAEHDRAAAVKLQARLRAAGEKGGEIVSR